MDYNFIIWFDHFIYHKIYRSTFINSNYDHGDLKFLFFQYWKCKSTNSNCRTKINHYQDLYAKGIIDNITFIQKSFIYFKIRDEEIQRECELLSTLESYGNFVFEIIDEIDIKMKELLYYN